MKAHTIHRTLLIVCLGPILPTGVLAEPIEWPVAEGGNGHFYELQTGDFSSNWAQQHLAALAQRFNGLQGHLATITSAAEYEWLAQGLFAKMPSHSVIYLGGWNEGFLTNPECGMYGWPLGAWHWITGESWEFSPWAVGEPSMTDGCTMEFALSYLHHWDPEARDLVGFNNLAFEFFAHGVQTGAARLVEFDGLAPLDLPPLDHPIPAQSTTWGGLKALYR